MMRSRSALAAVLLVSALAVHGCTTPPPAAAPIMTRLELRDAMRELWTSHVVSTRVFLISTIAGLADAPEATARLLQNQVDIGDAIRPFYGDAAGDRLTSLLHDHITIAATLVGAAMTGDEPGVTTASAAWYANADEIAHFLADANPYLPFADLRTMMRSHLDQTLAEATARLTSDWAADVAAYDAIVVHIEHMADALTDGVAADFPDLVSASPLSVRDESVHVAMRTLWQDHVSQTRFFLMTTIAGLPDAPFATQRLLRNQDDIGNAIRPFYGDASADQLTRLLRAHITGAAEVVAAAMAGDEARLNAASSAWYGNADDISTFLVAANPAWDLEDLRPMMRAHLDQTLAEATARLGAHWTADVVAYDTVVEHILHMSDAISAGVTTQFP